MKNKENTQHNFKSYKTENHCRDLLPHLHDLGRNLLWPPVLVEDPREDCGPLVELCQGLDPQDTQTLLHLRPPGGVSQLEHASIQRDLEVHTIKETYGYDGSLLRCLQVSLRLNPVPKSKTPDYPDPNGRGKMKPSRIHGIHGEVEVVLPAVFMFVVLQKSQAFLT